MKTLTFSLAPAFFIGFSMSLGSRPFRLNIENVTAYYLSDKVAINASIVDWETLTLYMDVQQAIERPFARIEIYVDSGNGILNLKLLNQSIDVCRFFKAKSYEPFMQVAYKIVKEQTNFPTSCPIKKELYVGENLKFQLKNLPSSLTNKRLYVGIKLLSMEGVLKPLCQVKMITKFGKR